VLDGATGAGADNVGEMGASDCVPAAAVTAVRPENLLTRFTVFQLASSAGSSLSALFKNASRMWTICRPPANCDWRPFVAPLRLPRFCARR